MMIRRRISAFIFLLLCAPSMAALSLWYRQAPSARKVTNAWMEYGLPIGNGHLGGMVMGGIAKAEVQLNEKTFWTGNTEELGAYQNIGYLRIEDLSYKVGGGGIYAAAVDDGGQDYRIDLDLNEAIITEEWTDTDGGRFTREYLVSNPDNVMAIHMTAMRQRALNLRVTLEGTHQEQPSYAKATGSMTTSLDLLNGAVVFRVSTTDGSVRATENGIELTNATEALLLVSAQTDYDPLAPSFVTGTDVASLLSDLAKHVSGITYRWSVLKARHTEDYQRLYQRMSLTLGGQKSTYRRMSLSHVITQMLPRKNNAIWNNSSLPTGAICSSPLRAVCPCPPTFRESGTTATVRRGHRTSTPTSMCR